MLFARMQITAAQLASEHISKSIPTFFHALPIYFARALAPHSAAPLYDLVTIYVIFGHANAMSRLSGKRSFDRNLRTHGIISLMPKCVIMTLYRKISREI